MLYQLYETQRAMMAPFSEFASATAKLLQHRCRRLRRSPWPTAVGRFRLMHRLAKEYEKPEFKITAASVGGVEVAVQEQVAISKPFCRLLRFKRFTDNPESADAHEDAAHRAGGGAACRATIRRCCATTIKRLLHDHKVYITDWTDARMVPVSAGPFPSGRLRRIRAGVHPPHRPRGAT